MSQTKSPLVSRSSRPIKPGTPPLAAGEIATMIGDLPGWTNDGGKQIHKQYKFKDFHETMAFVNKVADVANREDHHPDMEVGYNICKVKFSTHSVGGLSENDFISAAKVEALPHP